MIAGSRISLYEKGLHDLFHPHGHVFFQRWEMPRLNLKRDLKPGTGPITPIPWEYSKYAEVSTVVKPLWIVDTTKARVCCQLYNGQPSKTYKHTWVIAYR